MFSYDDASKMGKEMMDNLLTNYSAMAQAFQALATEMSDYSKKTYEGNSAAFEKLMAAKSFDKAFEIQSDYTKSAYEEFMAEATKMTEMCMDLARKAYEPYESATAAIAPPATKKAA